MAASAGKFAKRMETIVKAYKSNNKDPDTISHVLAHFKRACDTDGFIEGKALRIMSTFMKGGTASCLTVQMALHKENETTNRLLEKDKMQVSTFVETVSFVLKFFLTDSNIAMAASDIACLKNVLQKTSVQLAVVL